MFSFMSDCMPCDEEGPALPCAPFSFSTLSDLELSLTWTGTRFKDELLEESSLPGQSYVRFWHVDCHDHMFFWQFWLSSLQHESDKEQFQASGARLKA